MLVLGYRLLLNSPIGVRAGSSHSGGTAQHLARLVFLPSGVGLVGSSGMPVALAIRVRFGVRRNVMVPVSRHCLAATTCTESAFLGSLVLKVIILAYIAHVPDEAVARSYIPDAALATHRSVLFR